ncbi:hypothetical protein CPT_MarsHill_124 [Staphylococcus phage MarsHill]|nr:hypothetical protein CPT_MarsHill_124 [Staphylococcus phage MarsHill]
MYNFELYKNIDTGIYTEMKDMENKKYIKGFSLINCLDDRVYIVLEGEDGKPTLRHQGMTRNFIAIRQGDIIYKVKEIEFIVKFKNDKMEVHSKLTPKASTLNKLEKIGNFYKIRNLFYYKKTFHKDNEINNSYRRDDKNQVIISEVFEKLLNEIKNDTIDFYLTDYDMIEELENNKNKMNIKDFSKYKDGTLEDFNILNIGKQLKIVTDEREIKKYIIRENFK